MRLTPFKCGGETYYLLFNGAAMFNIYDQFGSEGSVVDHIRGNGRNAFEAVCWYLEELSTQGELYRRKQGFDKGPVLSAADLMVELSPLGLLDARAQLKSAIYAGFVQEEAEPPKEIDKGLLELEKKTGAG